jgi:NADPH:quinone reductase-like Zn-dependent oxidoreductase
MLLYRQNRGLVGAVGRLRACIEEEFALERAGEAYARLKGGRTRGKLVVKVT